MFVVLIARGWGVTNQELFQVPFERKWRALSNHPPKNHEKTREHGQIRRNGLTVPKSGSKEELAARRIEEEEKLLALREQLAAAVDVCEFVLP